VYFDSTTGNQDPYLWNDAFLHSYCHITQLRPEIGDINLWVSGDRFPEFCRLYCDLVFVVAGKYPWADANSLSPDDPLVDSGQAWADHYRWYPQHPFQRRARFTLKADPARSFQPQAGDGSLIDIVPFLQGRGASLDSMRAGMRAGTGSQPMTIPFAMAEAVAETLRRAPVILRGPELQGIRQRNPDLQSQGPGAAGMNLVNAVPQASSHRARCGC
jgi:hypothetical protein